MPDETPKCYTILEYILFKLDRTIAVTGLVLLGLYSLYRSTPELSQENLTMAIVGGLVGYIGGRAGASK